MLACVECGYEGSEFNVHIAGVSQGVLTYIAECPRCGSRKVKHLPRYHESDLRIYITDKENQLY